MSDHYFAGNPGDVFSYNTNTIVVATSSTSSAPIEVRITDLQLTSRQVYAFLEKLADFIASRDVGVVPTDMLKG